MKILIVEHHHPGHRKLLRLTLEAGGYSVLEIPDGAEALRLLERESVDAVISDILLPNLDGFWLCYEIRRSARWAQLPFIFHPATYGAYDPSPDEQLARKLGADVFLPQPAPPEAILTALQGALAGAGGARPSFALSTETGIFKEYSERLVARLEAKNRELASVNQELAESRARFEGVVVSAVDAIVMVDDAEKIVLFNAAAEAMFGCPAAVVLGQPLVWLLPKRFHGANGTAGKALVAPGAIACRFSTTGAGDEFPVEATLSQLEVGSRNLSTVILRDITDRRQAEAVLAESHSRFYGTLANIDLLAMTLDRNGIVTFCNDFLLRLTGWTRDEVIGQLWFSQFLPDSAEAMKKLFFDNLDAGAIPQHHRNPIKTRAGDLRTIAWNNTTLRDGANRVIGTASIGEDVTDREHAEAALRDSATKLRALALRLEDVREQERTAVAREIHDVLAQDLTLLKIDLVWLAKRLASPVNAELRPTLAERIAAAITQADAAITHVQRIATELRPLILDNLGLPAAVGWQVEDFARRTGLACQTCAACAHRALDTARATALFRILQECLTNIARHAKATAVEVHLADDPDAVILTVRDNGRGILPAEIENPRSIGLIGMSERAQAFGGTVQIGRAPGGGTTVTARISIEATISP